MPHFVPKQTVNVSLEACPEEYITIKAKFSLSDRNKIQGALVALDAQRNLDVDMSRYFNVILDLAIMGWNLFARDPVTDEILYDDPEKTKPTLIPFSRAMIADFDPDDPLIDKVFEEIARLNPTLANQGQKSMMPT